MEPEDPQMLIDLRSLNSSTERAKYDVFWDNCSQFLREVVGTAVDDRRHSEVVHLAQTISIRDQGGNIVHWASWASNLAIITKDEISIIKHTRKSVLFNDGKPWTKKDSNSLFDVTMGSYDGAEICELVGLFILNKLEQKFGKENIGLYRDDGLAIMKSKSARLADKTRKELHKCFEQFGSKITAEANLHVVNFLDVTFDLNNGKFKPYRKPNDDLLLYINRHSNHPPSIIKQLPTSINKRISALSADEQTFHESAPIYQNALRHSNFDHKLDYMKQAPQKTRRNRQRNIIWFNPPFSKNIKTNIARNFLCLIDKHFPPNHKLHKIFNRNSQGQL